ncbi:MAG: glucokinase [Candidatus Limnocylindrales bacterium]
MTALSLGFDLGGTNIRTAVGTVGPEGVRFSGRDERHTPQSGAADVIAAMAESARAALDAAGATASDLEAVGCSAPGPLDHRTGIVHTTQNIAGFQDVHLAERLAAAIGVATVALDRDTVMAAIGEALAGAAQGHQDWIYVTVSTGLGGAIVSGGRMVRGVSNTAGEIGHFPVGLDGPPCRCGSTGCAEAYAAGRNLAEAYGVTEAQIVYARARAGEERAGALIRRAEAALGNLAVGLVNTLNPSLIVVGGSVAEHEPSHVLEPMRAAIAVRAFAVPAGAVRVVPAALGADVGLIGAVLAARQRAFGGGEWFL